MNKYPYEVMEKLDMLLKEADSAAWLFSKTLEKDFSRHRELPFQRVAKLLIGMEDNSLFHEMPNCFHFTRDTPTVSALVQQRTKLLPEAMPFLFSAVDKAFPCRKTLDGYRLIACAGSDLHDAVNLLDTECFFQSNENTRGYNLLHLNVLYDVCSRRYTDAILQPRGCADEIGAFITMIDRFSPDEKVILTADRGYKRYNVMAHIIEKGMRFLIHVKTPHSNGILSKLRLPENLAFDMDFHIELTKKQTNHVKANPELYRFVPKTSRFDFCGLHLSYFYSLDFRVVAVEISPDCFEYLVTDLDASCFPPAKLKKLYSLRRGVVTSFRDLKYTIGLFDFHSKRAEFISQEVFARLILYNLCELVASHAALLKRSKSHVYQLNFFAAVHIFRHALFLASDESQPDVVSLILRFLLPVRPNRSDPRKVKFRLAISFLYTIS